MQRVTLANLELSAIAWLLRHPIGILPVFGTNSLKCIKTLSSSLNFDMDRETWFELYTLATGKEVP